MDARPPTSLLAVRVLGRGLRLWWRMLLPATLIAAALQVPILALQLRLDPKDAGGALLVLGFMAIVGALASAALTAGALRAAGGRAAGLLAMLAAGSQGLGRVLVVNFMSSALVLGGLFFFVVPGLVLIPVSFLAVPVALAEPQLSVEDVLRRGWALSRGRRPAIALLALGLLAILCGVDWAVSTGVGALASARWALAAEVAALSVLFGVVNGISVATYLALVAAPEPPPARAAQG